MVQSALIYQRVLAKGFVEAADFDGHFRGVNVFLVLGPGFQEEGLFCRACFADLQRCLVFLGDYSFPDSSVSVSMALIRGCLRLVRGQSLAKWPVLRHRKHPPFFRRRSRSASVSFSMASKSMGAGPR